MIQPASMFHELSQVLSHSEAMRAWMQPGRWPTGLESGRWGQEDPLAFMNLAGGERLSPLSPEERAAFRGGRSLADSAGSSQERRPAGRASQGGAGVAVQGAVGIAADQPRSTASTARIPTDQPRSAGSDGASGVVDARRLFEARSRNRGMAAVETRDDLFGPRVRAPIQMADWRAPQWAQTSSMLLSGEGMILWYRVDPALLAERAGVLASLVVGRGMACVCVGRYQPRETSGSAAEGTLLEVTMGGLVRGERGPELLPISRLVETSAPGGGLRGLAMQRPRELASIQIDPSPTRWRVAAQWRARQERLELEVESDHWLNRFGVGPLLSVLLPIRGARWPVGGGQARMQLDPRNRLRVGRATRVYLPERFHQGLLTVPMMAHPLSVTLAPRMSLSTFAETGEERITHDHSALY